MADNWEKLLQRWGQDNRLQEHAVNVESEYIIKTGSSDQKRLDVLESVYGLSTQDFLKCAGLKKGMRAADFGCGIGNTTRAIANIVGPTGSVIGIDNDESQLALACLRGDRSGKVNMEFMHRDVYDLSRLKNTFDFIYCRLLLINLKDPEKAIDQMISTLRPCGIIAMEEFINPSEIFCYPEKPAFMEHIRYLKQIHIKLGFQPEIGKKLKHLLLKKNMKSIKSKIFQPILENSTQRSLPYLNMSIHVKDPTPEYDKSHIINGLKDLIDDDQSQISYFNLIQIIALKQN